MSQLGRSITELEKEVAHHEKMKKRLRADIKRLRQTAAMSDGRPVRRRLSTAGRKRIAAAQKRRHAKARRTRKSAPKKAES